ncbi:MAG: beta-ketoacyl synthase [Bacteroidales bacterium]|nr:beta-ketoacyl synthase [Bacteroidales bacterium]
MHKVTVISEGMLTPLGTGVQENLQAVLEGKSALRLHEGTFGAAEPFYASLFEDRTPLPGCSFFETIAIRAAAQALSAAGIDPSSDRVRFVLSTIKGNVERLAEGDETEVPLCVPAGKIAAYFGNRQPAVVVSNACISGLAALLQGRRMLLSGICDHVVVIGAECQSRFIVSGFQSLKALSPQACKPFDAQREGLNLGEAAAAVVLGLDAPGWELADGAVRNDANHISGPSRTGEGSYQALNYVLASVRREELAFVNVHGTATLYNDEMESIALSRAGLSDVPVNALKGTFGHTMGAAGVLETILSMHAADAGLVLPTRGFSTLGVSCPVQVSAEVRRTTGRAFIKLLSGFGGVNGALLLRHEEGGAR